MKKSFLLLFLICSYYGFSKTTSSTAPSGFGFSSYTWDNGAPVAGDIVILNHNGLLYNDNLNFASLTMNDCELLFYVGSLTVGALILNQTSGKTNKLVVNGTNTLTVNGDITFSSVAKSSNTISISAGGTLNLAGGINKGGQGTLTPGGSCVLNMTGTGSDTLYGTNWGNITINKASGTVYVGEDIVSNGGSLTITSGDLDNNGHTFAGNASGSFSLASGQTYTCRTAHMFGASAANSWGGGYTINASSTIEFSDANHNIGIVGATVAVGNVTVPNNRTISGVGTLNIEGTMTLSGNSQFNVNATAVGGSGTITFGTSDTLVIESGSYPTTATITNASGFIKYSGSSQNIDAKDFEKLILAGSGTKTLSGAGSVSTSLLIRDGVTLNSNSKVFTIKSSAAGTAGVKCIGSGTTSGDFTVERYVSDMTATGNPGWWWMLGAPVNGQTIASIEDDILTTGVAGGDFPTQSFISVQSWDAAGQAYDVTIAQADAMTAGKGFFVYMGSSNPTYDIPYTIDYVGEINTGDFAFTGELNNIGATNEWAILANPYPSSVEFDLSSAMPNTDVKNPYQLNSAGGFSALSDNTILASGEGFWVESNSASPSLTFRESDKPGTLEANTLFNKSTKLRSSAAPDRLLIETTSMYAYEDFCYLELDDNKTFGMDYPSDFDKLENILSYTNVSMDVNGQLAHINTIPSNFTGVKSFPIHFSRLTTFSQTVGMTLKIKGVEDFKKRGICLSIEDLATGIITTLDTNYTVTTNWYDTVTAAQFILHLASGFEESTTDATCYGLSDGSVTAALSVSGTYDYFLKDVGGNIINQELGKSGISHTFNSLNAGMYSVEVNDNGSCGVISQNVTVDEPDAVLSSFSPNATTVDISIDPEVQFTNNSANAGNYFWNFDDGNTSSLDNPKHTFTLEKIHNVALVAEGGPCADTSYKTITVVNTHVGISELNNDKVKFYRLANNLQIDFNLNAADYVTITIFDVKGKQVEKSNAYSVKSNRISIKLPEAAGMYLITINGSSINTNKQVIVTN